MLIAVDIGNSSINIGYFTDCGLILQHISTYPLQKADEYMRLFQEFLSQNHIEKKGVSGIISSVVSEHTEVVANALIMLAERQDGAVLIVGTSMRFGITLNVSFPNEMGTDRLVNAEVAMQLYEAPVAVIDFGTATTITVVDKRGVCHGGAIMPGVGLMNDMLAQGTSKLKKVVLEPPAEALGRDTAASIRSGLFYGAAGAVERILSEIEREMTCRFTVVLTGGYSLSMERYFTRPHITHPYLIMDGLRLLYEKNRPA